MQFRWLLWLPGLTALVGLVFGVLALSGLLAEPAAPWVAIGLSLALLLFQYRIVVWSRAADNEVKDLEHRVGVLEMQSVEQRHAVDALADGLAVAIFLCNERGIIQFANREARAMFRFDDVTGRSVLEVTFSPDLETLVFDALRSGATKNAEVLLNHPVERTVRAQAWPESRQADRAFLSLYDITDLRRLERARRDFVANVSHELRTPMTAMRTMVESMQDDDDEQLRQRYFAKILSEVDRLTRLTDDLLTLSASESQPQRVGACDLAEVAKSTVAQMRPKAEAKGLRLSYDGVERAPVAVSPEQMTQVLVNLLDNAVNYTTEGGVEVRLSLEDHWAQLEIEDTGLGIPSDQLDRIFERFYRVDKGRSRATGGTGLGLSIVKHIVESHGGTVTVTSALNHGSTFTVRIPTIGQA